MALSEQELDEILSDFSAVGRTTWMQDPALGFGYVATDRDELGMPRFSPEIPAVPVALVERHQALWTNPEDGPQQEVWTEHAVLKGMPRLGEGVYQLPTLPGWVLAEWPEQGGGLQLQQPDGTLFVYAVCALGPEWLSAAQRCGGALVLHGPRLGLRISRTRPDAEQQRARELAAAKHDGLVTGGIAAWGHPV